MKNSFIIILLLGLAPIALHAQATLSVQAIHRQHAFPRTVPAGNYSGITAIDDSTYAIVDDKSARDGFHLFRIRIDCINGDIRHVRQLDFKGNNGPYRDAEGIAYCPESQTLFISGEHDKRIMEYTLDAQLTGRQLPMPALFDQARKNGGLESLAFCPERHTFYTTTENPLTGDSALTLRIQSFDAHLHPLHQATYRMDAPEGKKKSRLYAHGVSELTALPDGRLLVLERELRVPKIKIGATVTCKIYVFDEREKTLLCRWQTRLNLTRRSFANYEGMCLGPRLAGGGRVLILVADSQNQYGGLLKDRFRTIVIGGL